MRIWPLTYNLALDELAQRMEGSRLDQLSQSAEFFYQQTILVECPHAVLRQSGT